MVIVDTNILIGFLRHPDEETLRCLQENSVCLCGVVKAELMHGARSSEDCERLSNALECFPCLGMKESDWVNLGRNLYALRSHGVTVPFQDAIIVTIALSNFASVWTNDRHFNMMKTVFPDLKLFNS